MMKVFVRDEGHWEVLGFGYRMHLCLFGGV